MNRPKKYRTKTCEIEAIQFTGDNLQQIEKFAKKDCMGAGFEGGKCIYLLIETLEGTMKARIGDYIIKGLRGEFYPCKPDVFEKKYELIKK